MTNPHTLSQEALARQQELRDKCFHPSLRFTPFHKADVEQTIDQRFEELVRLFPDRLAIHTEQDSITYSELDEAANRVASVIMRAYPTERSSPIAILFSQSVNAVAAVLGVLKSGNYYVPLDPSLPHERMVYMLEDSRAHVLLTDEKNVSLAEQLKGNDIQVLNLDYVDNSPGPIGSSRPHSPDDLAWIIYTSGSTGRPKGVMQTHRNVMHFMMNYINNFHICEEDRLSLLFPCSVNAGSYGALLPLMIGAGLYSLDLKRDNNVSRMGSWVEQQHITIFCTVPTVFRRMANSLSGNETFPHLRLIYLAGESVLETDATLYKKHVLSNCLFVNRLGSTETDCISLFFMEKTTTISTTTVPVGYPVEDQHIMLLNEKCEEVDGEGYGQIAVKSRYISPGYWNQPDLTGKAFITSPGGNEERIYLTGDMAKRLPNGCLVHQGRKDFQIKIRGYRVEVAEIEMALLKLESIKEVVVVAQKDGAGEEKLIAYLVPTQATGPSCLELQETLAKTLPQYMIPAGFVHLEALPRAPNGKLYRKGLPEYQFRRAEMPSTYAPPMTQIQNALAAIWAEVLELDQIGIDDVFLQLGGNSLQAFQIATRIRKTWDIDLSIVQLFKTSTIRELEQVVEAMLEQDVLGKTSRL